MRHDHLVISFKNVGFLFIVAHHNIFESEAGLSVIFIERLKFDKLRESLFTIRITCFARSVIVKKMLSPGSADYYE